MPLCKNKGAGAREFEKRLVVTPRDLTGPGPASPHRPPPCPSRQGAFAVKQDVKFHPVDISLLGAQAAMPEPETVTQLVQQPRRLCGRDDLRGGGTCVDELIGQIEPCET
jgi:hypothetical protein